MRRTLTALLLGLSASAALACKCLPRNFADQLHDASQVFIGRAVRVNAEKSRCLFAVTRKFKGAVGDTLTIYSAPSSCRVTFAQGLTYVVFASRGQVQRCGGSSTPVTESDELGKLLYTFRKSFADSLGRDALPLLNPSEATYFDSELQRQRGAFRFAGQRVAFFNDTRRSNKQQYVQQWGGRDVVNTLLVLTPAEKLQSGGFDALIVSWRKQGVSRGFRQRLVKQLSLRL
ncbi:MAG: hypothetical protein EOO36_10415 [Cytophagaceae bacterium]|nr:MAG: hypothetical protein EOO36_10415 [Cytophagaceae bacterium]